MFLFPIFYLGSFDELSLVIESFVERVFCKESDWLRNSEREGFIIRNMLFFKILYITKDTQIKS